MPKSSITSKIRPKAQYKHMNNAMDTPLDYSSLKKPFEFRTTLSSTEQNFNVVLCGNDSFYNDKLIKKDELNIVKKVIYEF